MTFSFTMLTAGVANQWGKHYLINKMYPRETAEIKNERRQKLKLLEVFKRETSILTILAELFSLNYGLESIAADPKNQQALRETWGEISSQILFDL